MPLIECGDHSYAPMVIICRHLYDGESHSWCPIDSGEPEVDHDWLCPECFEHFAYIDVDDLGWQSVCTVLERLKSRSTSRNSGSASVNTDGKDDE